MSQQRESNMKRLEEALKRPSRVKAMEIVDRLLSLYPDSPTTKELTAAMVGLIELYPTGATERMFDLKYGIQTKCRFLPKAAELTEFLRPLEDQLYTEMERERREMFRALPPPEDAGKGTELTYEQLRQKYSPDGTEWGLQIMPGRTHYEKRERTEAEKLAALEDARQVGKELAGMKLSDEAIATLKLPPDDQGENNG